MRRLLLLVPALVVLAGCVKTGVSAEESKAQSEAWGKDAYEEAMIKAGKEEELRKEQEGWDQRQAEQDASGGSAQPGSTAGGN